MQTSIYSWSLPSDTDGNKTLAVRDMAGAIETTVHSVELRVLALETAPAPIPGAAISDSDGTLADTARAVNAMLVVLRAKGIIAT